MLHKMHSEPKIGQLQYKNYKDVDNTLSEIKKLIKESAQRIPENSLYDVFDNYDLQQIYNYVRNVKYVLDPIGAATAGGEDVELLKAPWATDLFGGDCDCKSIFLGMYFERHKIPYRMAVISSRPDKELHHIYPEIFLNGQWLAFDATYPLWDKNYIPSQPFKESPFTVKRIYDWNCGPTISFEVTKNTPLTHAQMLDCTKLTSDLIKNNDVTRVRNLHGVFNMSNLNGAVLATLSGQNKSISGCSSCSNKKRQRLLRLVQSINDINSSGQLSGDGFDFSSIASSVINFISGWFGGRPAYVDAYHAYTDAIAQMTTAANQLIASNNTDNTALAHAAGLQAIIAALRVDVMNPPVGADLCTPPGDNYYCGNRAKWDDIKATVQAKANQAAPFFAWRMIEHKGISEEDLIAAYNSFKNHSGDYATFIAQYPSGTIPQLVNTGLPGTYPPGVRPPITAGMNTTVLLVAGAIGLVVYEVVKKSKHKRVTA